MKSLVIAVVVAWGSVQAACDRGASSTTAVATNGPTVKVVDAGTGAKKTLRFTAAKGLTKTMTMAMDMSMSFTIGGTPRTQAIPTIKMPLMITVTDVEKNGDIHFDFVMKDPEVVTSDPYDPAASAVKSALDGMSGLSGKAIVTDRGFTKQVEMTVPAGANPQIAQFVDSMKQSIGQMSAPLPEEPVGVGATWETTTKLEQSNMTMLQTATNKLVSLDGNTMTLDIGIRQTAPAQKIRKDGITVDLKRYAATGSATTTLDLTQVVPASSKVTLKSDMSMEASGQKVQMGLDLTVTMTSD